MHDSKRSRSFLHASLALLATATLAAFAGGCSDKQTVVAAPTAAPPAPVEAAPPLCGVPTNTKYQSVSEGVCGGKPCRWLVNVRAAAGDSVDFTWYHNGQNRVGTCACGGGDALSCRLNAAETFSAQFDAQKNVLQWGGEEYNTLTK